MDSKAGSEKCFMPGLWEMRGARTATLAHTAHPERWDNYFFYVHFQLIQKISTIIQVNKFQAHGRVFKDLVKVAEFKK